MGVEVYRISLIECVKGWDPDTATTADVAVTVTMLARLFDLTCFGVRPDTATSAVGDVSIITATPFTTALLAIPTSSTAGPLGIPTAASTGTTAAEVRGGRRGGEGGFFPDLPVCSSVVWPVMHPLFFARTCVSTGSYATPGGAPPVEVRGEAKDRPGVTT